MSVLTQMINFAMGILNLAYTNPSDGSAETAKTDLSVFPYNYLRQAAPLCTTFSFEMGENELKSSVLAKGFCTNCCPSQVQRDIRFVSYTKSYPKGSAIEHLLPGYAQKVGIDSKLPTVLFIHGFTEASPGRSGRSILNAYYSRREPRNIILLDWSELAPFPWYQVAVVNVKVVAERLKKFIEAFNDSGEIPIKNLHVIGFSLGSHIAGVAGKKLRNGLRIPRITGLDPALPEYSLTDSTPRLSKESAEYVDVIHTDSGIFGFPIELGHADFFPNGGRALQPGCQPSFLVRQQIVDQVVACSHLRAWQLYSESVVNPKAFPASRCTLWRGPEKECEFSIDAYMGFGNTNATVGSFYLITGGKKPYGVKN